MLTIIIPFIKNTSRVHSLLSTDSQCTYNLTVSHNNPPLLRSPNLMKVKPPLRKKPAARTSTDTYTQTHSSVVSLPRANKLLNFTYVAIIGRRRVLRDRVAIHLLSPRACALAPQRRTACAQAIAGEYKVEGEEVFAPVHREPRLCRNAPSSSRRFRFLSRCRGVI